MGRFAVYADGPIIGRRSSGDEAADDERVVLSAKAERVGTGDIDLCLTRGIGDVVEVALGVGVLIIDRRRADVVADGQNAGDQLDRAGGGDQVAHHRLDGGDGDVLGEV